MTKVLVLEDEAAIRGFIAVNLRRHQYTVIEADSGEAALAAVEREGDVSVALLDVMLPGIDGIEVCRILRQRHPQMGIIMLTARGLPPDRVNGLVNGADDYVVKPFSPAELIARIGALLRRGTPAPPHKPALHSGPFTIMTGERTLTKAGRAIDLTPTEYGLIQLFMTSDGAALTRDEILDRVWGLGFVGDPKVVDVNIRRLRQKIEDDPAAPRHLISVRGYGYRWQGGEPS